jgi:hypothetical protein
MDKFKAKFIKSCNETQTLLWCFFKDDYKENIVMFKTKDLLEILDFSSDRPIYIYFDRTGELFQATFFDLSQYFLELAEWETKDTEFNEPWGWEIDAEVFDETLEWVIAVTHEDVSMLLGFESEY